jgi:hypothetical protein
MTILRTAALLSSMLGMSLSMTPGCENYAKAYDNCGMKGGAAVSFMASPALNMADIKSALTALNATGIKPATFFLSPGANGGGPAMLVQQCDIAKAIIAQGHEVQAKSYSGRPLSTMTDQMFKSELQMFNSWLLKCVNMTAKVVIGADGMKVSQAQVANTLGMQVSFWNLDPQDYKFTNGTGLAQSLDAEIARYKNTYHQQRPSSVVLLSDNTLKNAALTFPLIASSLKGLGDMTTQSVCAESCDARDNGLCPDISEPNYILSSWRANDGSIPAAPGVCDKPGALNPNPATESPTAIMDSPLPTGAIENSASVSINMLMTLVSLVLATILVL